MPAGVTLQPKALAFGGQAPGTANQMAVSEIDFEEIVVDADGNVVRREAKPLSPLVLTVAVEFGPAAPASLRTGGSSRFSAWDRRSASVRALRSPASQTSLGADGWPRSLARRREAGTRASPEGQSAGPAARCGRSRVPDRGARVSRYRYLPWVRRRRRAYDTPDTPPCSRGRTTSRCPRCPSRCSSTTRPGVVAARLYGPGDVIGIDPRAVLRTDPLGHTADFEPNYLGLHRVRHPRLPVALHARRCRNEREAAAVARARRGAPRGGHADSSHGRRAAAEDRRAGERAPRPVGVMWAWAHAQVVELDASQSVEQILGSRPERNLSRLVCPRRLEPRRTTWRAWCRYSRPGGRPVSA